MNIKYRPIKAFLLAVECMSFTHAASQLGVTQPSFSILIQDLERTLGVQLFERSTRSLALTSAGRDFLARMQRPIHDVEEAYRSLLDLSAARRGHIMLGSLPSAAFALVTPALQSLKAAYPAIRATISEAHNDKLIEMLRTNQIECAVATLLEPAPDLVFTPWLDDCFFAVHASGHPLSSKPVLDWADLEAHELILISRGSSARRQVDRLLEEGGVSTPAHYDVTNMVTALAMARRGLGVTVLPRLALGELGLRGLQAKPIQSDHARRTVGLLERKDRSRLPAVDRFAEHAQKMLAEVDASLPPAPTQGKSAARRKPPAKAKTRAR